MPLTAVTISGADDNVRHEDLLALSREFPFVEFGLLFSRTRAGTPRYPSKEWLSGDWCRFEPTAEECARPSLRLSAHLCGSLARDVLTGDEPAFVRDFASWNRNRDNRPDDEPPYAFNRACARVQVNGFAVADDAFLRLMQLNAGQQWILQVRDQESFRWAAWAAGCLSFVPGTVAILWDASGGRGIVGTDWPHEGTPLPVPLGRAGGITPETIEQHCAELASQEGERWLDMESGVRTDDRFDLDKVRRVLEIAAPYIRSGD